MEFNENIVLGGSNKEYCEYGPATGMSCWVYEVLNDCHLIRLSGLIGSEADSPAGYLCSFPRRRDPQFSYCVASLKKQGGRNSASLPIRTLKHVRLLSPKMTYTQRIIPAAGPSSQYSFPPPPNTMFSLNSILIPWNST